MPLPVLVASPAIVEARAGRSMAPGCAAPCSATVGMALHHKICHTLGGSFDLPHAETHAVMLPHTVGFNAGAVPGLLAPVATDLRRHPGAALFDFAQIARSAAIAGAISDSPKAISTAPQTSRRNRPMEPAPGRARGNSRLARKRLGGQASGGMTAPGRRAGQTTGTEELNG
jgi:maleylacetate reductase